MTFKQTSTSTYTSNTIQSDANIYLLS